MDLILFAIFILSSILFSLIEILERRSFIILDLILLIFFVLLVANRSIPGTEDTYTYVDDFNSISTKVMYLPTTVDTKYKFEYGYTLFSQVFKMVFGDNIKFFFGFLATVNLVIVIFSFYFILQSKRVIKKSFSISSRGSIIFYEHNKNILYAPLFSLYASYFGLMYSGIVLRQGLAISIILMAFYFLINRKYIWGMILLLVSFFFHNTAVFSIGILLFVFKDYRFKKSTYYKILILTFSLYLLRFFNVISTFVSSFLFQKFNAGFYAITSDKVNTYLGRVPESVSEYSLSILANFIFSFVAIKLSDNTDRFQNTLLQINLFAISIISLLAGIQAITRAIDYYSIFNILLFYIILISRRMTTMKLVFFVLIVISNSIIFYRLAII